MLTVGSLFAGIGGFDLGLERAGMTVKWQIENDEFCNKVLEKHWPNIKRFEDIKEVSIDELEPVDVICGGFPCQPFSQAGHRRSKDDDRYLWPEMLRIIEGIRPNWVIGENVAGIVNLALDTVLSNLEDEGYTWGTFIIPACSINAPHRRDRVWIVAQDTNSKRGRGWCENIGQVLERETTEIKTKGSDRKIGQVVADSDNSGSGASGNRFDRDWSEKDKEQEGFPQSEFSGHTEVSSYTNCSGSKTVETKLQTTGSFECEQFDLEDIATEQWEENWISVATRVCRMDDGFPKGMDRNRRLKALGNAIVPQIAEIIGKSIVDIERRVQI